MARTPLLERLRNVQSVEANDSCWRARNLGAGDADRRHRQIGERSLVLQWLFSLAGHAVLCANYRTVVLVHRSVHCAARAGSAQ